MLAALLHPKKGRYENMNLNYCIKHNQQKKKVTNGLWKAGRNPAFERCSSHLWLNENKVSRVVTGSKSPALLSSTQPPRITARGLPCVSCYFLSSVGLSRNVQLSLLKIISFGAVGERKVSLHTRDI